MSPPSTIAQIAHQAGVSTATVDRVVNRRGGVNADTERRVLQVIDDLGVPWPPGRPRTAEGVRFAFVLPLQETAFIELVERQIAHAAGDFRHQHVTEITHRIDTRDPARFAAELMQLRGYKGIALFAPDLPAVKLAINELVRSGVYVVTLFSDVSGSMRQAYIGSDNRAAGRTAGLLVGHGSGFDGRDIVLLSSQATRMSSEIERCIGFAQVIQERFPALRLLRTPDLPMDDVGAQAVFADFIGSEIDPARITGVYIVGSGAAGVAGAIDAAGVAKRVSVVAHDLTEGHRALLNVGSLAFLLHQDIHYCVLAAVRVLRALCENVRGALTAQPPIQILTAENVQ
jgi:LacI family transcriptional regulator